MLTLVDGAVELDIARAKRGDRAAFERLYREHVGRVYALCLRLTGNVAEAEERTQEVFVQAFTGLGAFRGESALSTWLHRIALNAVLARRRAELRADLAPTAVTDVSEPLAPARSATLAIDLERAIASLPEGARVVFVLFEIEGHSHEEIAELLEVTVGTTKAQLHRARGLLKERLK